MKYTPLADHHLQLDILRKLFAATAPISFSALKEDGIDNSLFMYHMNKLIARKLVQKTDDGFALSQLGAHWVNTTGIDSLTPLMYPKVLVQLLVFCDNAVLVGKREGAPGTLLNSYLLPGTAVHLGTSVQETANVYAQELGIETPLSYSGQYEHIQKTDDFWYHSICSLYTATLPERIDIVDKEAYTYHWLDRNDILLLQNEPALTGVLREYEKSGHLNGTLFKS